MTLDSGPAVQQAQLIRRLTQLRKDQGWSQNQVARDLEWSYHKMMRFETGKQVLPKTELEALLRLYGVMGTPAGDELVELGQGARQPAWWKQYRTYVSRDYLKFVGLEAGADSIRQVQMSVVPGLLQTPEYARVLATMCRPEEAAEKAEKIVELRMKRQEKLRSRVNPPKEIYIIDESVLRRHVGKRSDPGIMRRQIERLLKIFQNGLVRIHVIPQGSDWMPGMLHSFSILSFSGGLDDLLFTESNGPSATPSEEMVSARKHDLNELMRNYALGGEGSFDVLEDVHRSLSF
ncbi:helix-turn-helix domain-containing protein [Nocardiopsis lambiniae]|uniref:Helix-turn-helix transcriptional regulator n=1 Tax=Nocardiopsis lambiniae TaxID=3075539 RepID=A0ABU2M6K5_9ACTN|nr:helix-turn-helix transcriptional regulator [Nocardiopsis sp. DSM 44743]MDT0328291.1 helix-turn-helix transcriptional regulator [Nocardiopsis sp. DSM 44743]